MKNHSSMTGWEELFFSYKSFYFSPGVAIAASGIYGLKFLGHLILIIIMLIQLVLANVFQSTLFSCLPKVDQVINSGIN